MIPHSGLVPGAGLKRLVFYYPEAGDAAMLKLLTRPFYHTRVTYNFFEKTLVGSKRHDWDQQMSRFRAEHGETGSLGVLKWALSALCFPESHDSQTPEIQGDG